MAKGNINQANKQPNQDEKGSRSEQSSKGNAKQTQKQKQKSDTFPIIPQKDLFQRINFSYQAAILLQSLGSAEDQTPGSGSASGSGSRSGNALRSTGNEVGIKIDRKGKRKAVENQIAINKHDEGLVEGALVNGDKAVSQTKKKFRQLARMNIREMNHMAVHNQLKLDPSLKRSLCKTCGTVLIPGLTSRIRNRPNRNSFSITHHTCLTCLSALSIPAPPIPIPIQTSNSEENSGIEYEIDKEGLDGKIRKIKRKKASKRGKKIFHEIENSNNDNGHTLWKGEKKLEGWGMRSIDVVE